MKFTLTPKRIAALRFIAQRPCVYVGCVATNVLARVGDDGSIRPMASQAATRNGAGYCKKLANAGLVTLDTYGARTGYGRATLTEAGRAALLQADAAAAVARDSLSAVLLRCEAAAA